MGVSSIVNRVAYAGNGVTTTFSFPYYFFSQSDLFVYIYDTILGGISGPKVLNTDYTVTGAVNYQGLYQSGGSVNLLLYVPLATDIVVISREPIEQQNFALLQGGTIPSAALVQQFDYLTLLVQKLQDQVNRCLQLPDGFGEAFSMVLPSNLQLGPGLAPVINAGGTGWQMGVGGSGGGGGITTTVTNGGNTNYNLVATDQYVRSGTVLTAPRNWTLPPASNVGQRITIKNLRTQGFSITVLPNGADTIEGLASVVLAPDQSLSVECGSLGVWDLF